MIVVVMGVSGAGKTTVGQALAERMGWPFYDADAFHGPASVDKMRRGDGLTDADRAQWLDALVALLSDLDAAERSAVLACSALRDRYRHRLAAAARSVRFVFLEADAALIRERLTTRTGHYAGPSLLDSQFATLEPPAAALTLDAGLPVDDLVDAIVDELER